MGELDDRTMILSPQGWIQWPCLPVKRKGKQGHSAPECGVIFVPELLTVVLVNLWDIPRDEAEFKTLRRLKYESVDALLSDGWVVD